MKIFISYSLNVKTDVIHLEYSSTDSVCATLNYSFSSSALHRLSEAEVFSYTDSERSH